MMKASTQLEQIVSVGRGKWLAPAGTAMAMLACYGVTAVIGLLSLIGISVALPFRAPIIILFFFTQRTFIQGIAVQGTGVKG